MKIEYTGNGYKLEIDRDSSDTPSYKLKKVVNRRGFLKTPIEIHVRTTRDCDKAIKWSEDLGIN